VIDLGVMVPGDRILDTALEEGCDVVGLSGLITPSLDEMVTVAKEMERRGLQLPLLIGGATTSKQHTAVKIAPEYAQPTLHVLDASRVVRVVASLLDPGRKGGLDEENRELQEQLRELHAEKERKPLLPLEEARANKERVPFGDLAEPPFTGTRLVEPDLATLREYIDWQFFFHAWELKGKYPAILDQPAARELFDDAQELLDQIVRENLLSARGVHGFWPASSDGEDIAVADEGTSLGAKQWKKLGYIAVDADALGRSLKWEPSRGGALFPHLYAPLPLSAVRWTRPLPRAADGRHIFPELEP